MTAIDPRARATAPLLRYLPGIDGLRALSVLAVIAYHLDATWATGGYLGVEVFFVVSGFLITSLLLEEQSRTGRIDRPRFWLRRARRLLPAVVTLIIVVSAWAAVGYGPGELVRHRGDAIASLLYVQNWWAIVADQPYFASFGRPSPFRHLWSLAIEEQFYLLWPLVLPVALSRLGRRRTIVALLGAAAGSALLMGALSDIAAPERAYYGTDTRLTGILAGAVVAFVWKPRRADPDIGRPARWVIDGVGVAALATLGWQAATRSEYDPWTYPWGFLVVDLACVAVLVAATHPAGRLERTLGTGALQALGRRSYSLYLWHWPVIVSTRPGVDWGLEGPTALVARLVLIAAISEISYRLIEQPFRDGRFQAWVHRARGEPRWGRTRVGSLVRAPVLAAVAVSLVLAGILAGAPPAGDGSVLAAADQDPAPEELSIDTTPLPVPASTTTVAPTSTPTTVAVPATDTAPPPPPPVDGSGADAAASPEPAGPPADGSWPSAPAVADPDRPGRMIEVTVIGESVTLGAARTLQDHYGDRVQIDAAEGRHFSEGVELVEALAAAGRLTPTVIIHLGNNGVAPKGALDRIVAAVGPERRLLLVSVHVPRRWESQVNGEIFRVVRDNATVLLADWDRLADTEADVLADDGVHLSARGKLRYRDMLADQAP